MIAIGVGVVVERVWRLISLDVEFLSRLLVRALEAQPGIMLASSSA
jgi:hypothetical protein